VLRHRQCDIHSRTAEACHLHHASGNIIWAARTRRINLQQKDLKDRNV
jgi:hypothetical protein